MQIFTGIVRSIAPLVVNGNTIHVFTLAKPPGHCMQTFDEVYAAVFVTPPPNGDGKPTDLALYLAFVSAGDAIKVTVEDIDGDVPIAEAANLKLRLTVVAVEAAADSSHAGLRDC